MYNNNCSVYIDKVDFTELNYYLMYHSFLNLFTEVKCKFKHLIDINIYLCL